MNSIKTTEELLNENKRWSYIRTDRNGTRYFSDSTCPRCGGRGRLDCYGYVEGGICFECGGSGISKETIIKVYTPEHAEKLRLQREARAKKVAAEREEKAKADRPVKLKSLGFSCEGEEWVVYRVLGETYSIKDTLKKLGCRFNSSIGWYSGIKLDDYETQRLTSSEVLTDSVYIEWKSKDELKELLDKGNSMVSRPESTSEWQGEIGQRVEILGYVSRVIPFSNQFGESYIYLIFDKNKNVYKWSTAKALSEKKWYHLKATIKDHLEYKGVKQTVITRGTIIREGADVDGD